MTDSEKAERRVAGKGICKKSKYQTPSGGETASFKELELLP
jgi:hypothetical protein